AGAGRHARLPGGGSRGDPGHLRGHGEEPLLAGARPAPSPACPSARVTRCRAGGQHRPGAAGRAGGAEPQRCGRRLTCGGSGGERMRGHPDGETIAAFRDDLLPARKAARIAAHLAECPRCAEVDAQLAAVTAALARTPTPPMPASLAARLDAALAAEVAARSAAGAAPAHADSAGGPAPAAPADRTAP